MAGVAEAAVTGVPDPVLGEAIHAFVVPANGAALTNRDILRHCAERLEEFLVPRKVEICESLAKSPNGKVDKKQLVAE